MEITAIEFFARGDVLGALLTGFVLAIGAYFKFKSPSKPDVTNAALADKVSHLDSRLARVESDFAHLPTRSELHGLQVRMATLEAKVTGAVENTKETRRAVQRIESILIEIGTNSTNK